MAFAVTGAEDQMFGLRSRFPSVAFVHNASDTRVLLRSLADCQVLISHIRRWWGEHHDGQCRPVGDGGTSDYYYSSRRCSEMLLRLDEVVKLGGCHPADPRWLSAGPVAGLPPVS